MGLAPLPARERTAAVARVRREVARALDRDHLIDHGETVVVGCSGGADSSTLLDALVRLAPPRELTVHVAHVNHGLREAAAAEGRVVEEMAAAAGIPFHGLTVEVGHGGSLQERARRARHAALAGLARELGATAVALGHTADDQAETVLMRALTGATPTSLAAMRARNGRLRRPLLRLWRADIDGYCRAVGIEPVDDPSNADPRFLRTRVRHELLPALEAVFPGARRQLAAIAEHQQALLDQLAGR